MAEARTGATAGAERRLRVSVVSPERILLDGEASSVVVPAHDGLLGILPRHAPLLALLGRGVLSVRGESGADHRFRVSGGFVQVRSDMVRVVAEEATDLDPDDEAAG